MFVPDISYYMGSINHPEMLTESQKDNLAQLYNKFKGYAEIEKRNKGTGYSTAFGTDSLNTIRAESELKSAISAINAEHEELLQTDKNIDTNPKMGF